ncbi:MAG: hypothetical protein IKT31_05220 [Firmicutes bacterium]|nr:hypothetical protein [Bacillota bacterium]
MNDKKRMGMPATGGSSLLVIFAVLALTVFAILSISTVTADQKLADKSAASVEAYYEADCQAEMILAEIRSGKLPEGVKRDGNLYSYKCPVTDSLNLEVEVLVGEEEYEVLRWQMVSAADWQNDDSLPVWDGEVIIEESNGEGEGIWPL